MHAGSVTGVTTIFVKTFIASALQKSVVTFTNGQSLMFFTDSLHIQMGTDLTTPASSNLSAADYTGDVWRFSKPLRLNRGDNAAVKFQSDERNITVH